ncbi:MAG: PAS domain-containing protein, partial [Gammaproteobacteria bacterium]|nr:PAS domain-containing protein [Gammaproteobacteria bacterium]
MSVQEDKFEIKLPARITGLVFWGLVLIGLLVAVIYLQYVESNLAVQKRQQSLVLAYDIESIAEQYSKMPVLVQAAGKIRSKINEHIIDFDFNSVRLYDGEESLVIGSVNEGDDVYEYTLYYYPFGSSELHSIKVEIYTTNTKQAISTLRKQILLSVGIGVFVFGLFLQRILQKMLSKPFHRMVQTAEKFSEGDELARFDEDRADEFGYLGKFINNAIDNLITHKNEISLALERASASEAALSVEKERAEVTLHSITDTVITVDVDERVVYINPAGKKLLICENNECGYGMHFKDIFKVVEESSGEVIGDLLHECFETGEITHMPEHSSLIVGEKSMLSIEASIAPMKSENGDLLGAVIVVQDVSHTRRLTRQLSYQASHDLLTGLYNRRKFEENLEEILINVREEDRH